MIGEAAAQGLAVNTQAVHQLAWGIQRQGSPFTYVAPDLMCDPHQSMTKVWKLLEWLPKSDRYKEWKELRSHFDHYIPNGEPRPVSDEAFIHESVLRRVEAVPHYRPVNLPQKRRIVPMPVS
jgi:hypothetical protein